MARTKLNNFLVFDAAPSARSIDDNGFMHVRSSHLTKAVVNPYYGSEIPGWKEHGLEANQLYYGYRDPEELKKSLRTWAGLPLHLQHHTDSADEPAKLTRVGSVGTNIVWNAPYVDAPLTVWDKEAQEGIESGRLRALSCGYRYEPDFTPGVIEGIPYDFVMRDISGNHVALVADGRAGAEVVVADHNTIPGGGNPMPTKKTMAKDSDSTIEQKEVELAQAIIDLHKVDPMTGEVKDVTEDNDKTEALKGVIAEIASKVDPETLKKLCDAVNDLAFVSGDSKATDEGASDKPAPASEDTNPQPKVDTTPAGDGGPDIQAIVQAVLKALEEQQPDADDCKDKAPEACDTDNPDGAQDSKPAPRKKEMALDANTIKAQAVAEARQHMQALYAAASTVEPLVGRLNAMAFDSASDVYKHALSSLGVQPDKYDRTAWKGMVDMALRQKAAGFKLMAQDSKPELDGHFKYLKNINI